MEKDARTVNNLDQCIFFFGLGLSFILKTKTSSLAYKDRSITLIPQQAQTPFT